MNSGVEGPTDDPAILALRRQLRRNQFASLLLAQGVPLLLAGDEVGNSQGGNNNAYCQDNAIGWVDWSRLDNADEDLTTFVGRLTELRRRYPQLRPRHWLKGALPGGAHDVIWVTPAGQENTERDWQFPEGRFLAYVLAPAEDAPGPLFIVLNGAPDAVEFVLPAWPDLRRWKRVLTTAGGRNDAQGASLATGAKASAAGRSVSVFEGEA